MKTQRQPGPLDAQFEAGYVPCDEPPGLTEIEYQGWKAAGGTVKAATVAGAVWAICELMGHVRLAGRLTEEEKFGTKMGRLDIPTTKPCTCPNAKRTDAMAESIPCPKCHGAGFINSFVSQFFGGSSVYRITIVTEEVARHVCKQASPAPVSPWDFPKQTAATVAAPGGSNPRRPEYDDDRDDDDSDDCRDRPF